MTVKSKKWKISQIITHNSWTEEHQVQSNETPNAAVKQFNYIRFKTVFKSQN